MIVVSRNKNNEREKEEINLSVLAVVVKDDENELVDKRIIGIDMERINENRTIIPIIS